MTPTSRLKFVFLGLTGQGTQTLRALMQRGYVPDLVVTRHERGPYPYHEEQHLLSFCREQKLSVCLDVVGEQVIQSRGADLLICSTYHRILGGALLAKVGLAVNLHPSLLPAYQGASPLFWVIKNQEKVTGVTLHKIDSKVDQGEIYRQQTVAIEAEETQGSLREKLGLVAGAMACDFYAHLNAGGECKPILPGWAPTCYPRFTYKDQQIDLNESDEKVFSHIRALMPWPKGLVQGREVVGFRRLTPQIPAQQEEIVLSKLGIALVVRPIAKEN